MDKPVYWGEEDSIVNLLQAMDFQSSKVCTHRNCKNNQSKRPCSLCKKAAEQEHEDKSTEQVPVSGKLEEFSDSESDGVSVRIEVSPKSSSELDYHDISSDVSPTPSYEMNYQHDLSIYISPTASSVTNYQDFFSSPPSSSVTVYQEDHSTDVSPTSSFEADYQSFDKDKRCRPLVVREGSEESVSLLGRHSCTLCCENPANTCVMHHSERHMDLCYSCAIANPSCPLCGERILYVYMYDDV